MYSEALREMDRNTELFMVSEARRELEILKKEREELAKETEALTKARDDAAKELDAATKARDAATKELDEIQSENQALRSLLEAHHIPYPAN